MLFNIFINDMVMVQSSLSASFLGGVVDMQHGCAAIQRHLKRPEKWANRKFNKEMCQIHFPGKSNPRHHHVLGHVWLESSMAKKASGILVDTNLTISHQYASTAKKAKQHPGLY